MNIQSPIVKRGKLVTSGSSIVITMPKEWIEEHKLKAGDEVMIISNGNVTIQPITEKNVEKIRNQLFNATRTNEGEKGRESSSPSKS